jgi:hypothetical protein
MKLAGRIRAFRKALLVACPVFVAMIVAGAEQPVVHVETSALVAPRTLEKQTETAVVRDYLQAWQTLSSAMEQNRADLLDADFVGVAKDKLADTIREQHELGIHARYRDLTHDLSLVFYSPEGLSVQLVDTVQYDVQIEDHDKVQATQHVRSRYVVVLTPTEVRWKVRIFQGGPA